MAEAPFTYTDLNLETTGPEAGEPVLLLHGWGSNATLMRPIAEALQDRYRVYNLDLPGHGASPPPPEGWGVPEHAALVYDLIQHEMGGTTSVVGHSNGGRISLYIASTPALAPALRRMVLLSPSGITPRRTASYHIRKNLASALKAPFGLLPASLREHGLDWLRHSLVWRALGSSDYQSLSGVMRETFVKTVNCYLDDRVHNITVPTLLCWGDQDPAVSREQMAFLEKEIPDAGLVVLEGAGHYGHLDSPTLFNAATRHFLDHA